MQLMDYMWLVVVGSFAAFMYGFGTGSNDVANAFGTSVGAKTLSLKQAVIIAAIFEFTGAMVLGRVSTATISGGIADIKAFQACPEMFAYGMVCALTVAGLWQILSSYLSFNTSSTHSIIGSIIGFSLLYAGNSGVLWITDQPTQFPPYGGVVPIVVAWFFSPIACATSSALLFLTIRFTILRRSWAYKGSFFVLPPLVFGTVMLCLYFVFTKGAKKTFQGDNSDWTDQKAAWVSAAVAAGLAFVVACCTPLIMMQANKKFAVNAVDDENKVLEVVEVKPADGSPKKDAEMADELAPEPEPEFDWKNSTNKEKFNNSMRIIGKSLGHGTNVDIHAIVEEDELINKIHANAELFAPKVEYVFQYLQVFSACCVIFAHGAGEVGYMAGPLATVWEVVQTGQLQKNVQATAWIVVIGALGLVVGLATYGYNVVRAMGVKLAKLSPSRGFCAELSTALVIMIASQYGLPTSSSQVITGGIIGVGLCEGVVGVNWNFFAVQFASWVLTLFVCGIGTAALFAMGAYAPSVQMQVTIAYYEQTITALTVQISGNMNKVATSYTNLAVAGTTPLTSSQVKWLSGNMTSLSKAATTQIGTSVQTANPNLVVSYLTKSISAFQQNSVNAIGQLNVYVPGNPANMVCNNNASTAPANCVAPPILSSPYYGYP